MALPQSFFVREGDTYLSTELTRGPWSNEHQHGGPPSALMARAAETHADDAARFFTVRLTVDYFKPIPITPLRVAIESVKLGKTAQRLTVKLLHRGDELARAHALRIRRAPGSVASPRPGPLPSPDGLQPFVFPFFQHDVGYHVAIEARYLKGRFGDNEATVWMRQSVPLIAGEQPSGLQRVVVVADAESGVCNPLSVTRHTFVNPDLTVLLDREPQGEWICLDALSTASSLGIGLAQSAVHDAYGLVGRSAQSLVVDERKRT